MGVGRGVVQGSRGRGVHLVLSGVLLHVEQIVAVSVKLDHEEQFARSLDAGMRTNQGRNGELAAVCTQSM